MPDSSKLKTELQPRRKPVQERAIRSRAHILHTAGNLLDEVGLDAFNTNLLAERADVRVRTVYRYFPNKWAVVAAIGEDLFELLAKWTQPFFDIIATPGSDWERQLPKMIQDWGERLSRHPGGWAVLQALNIIPVLREMDRQAFDDLADQWRSAILQRVPDYEGDLDATTYAIIVLFYAYFDNYPRIPEPLRSQVARELAEMTAARLRPILNGGTS